MRCTSTWSPRRRLTGRKTPGRHVSAEGKKLNSLRGRRESGGGALQLPLRRCFWRGQIAGGGFGVAQIAGGREAGERGRARERETTDRRISSLFYLEITLLPLLFYSTLSSFTNWKIVGWRSTSTSREKTTRTIVEESQTNRAAVNN